MKRRTAALAGLALLLALALLAGRSTGRDALAVRLQARSVPATAFRPGDPLRLTLERLGLIHAVPPAGGGRGSYSLDPLPRSELAAALGIDPEWLRRPVTVAALLLPEEDLEELFAQPNARGREWERQAFFALVDDGELALATEVGVRLHGGWSRSWREEGSFRIYFRERYGLDRVPLELFPERRAAPPNRLLLRHDGGLVRGGHWRHFTNSLGLDVAREIGLPAPHVRPAAVFVNGRFAGVKALTEWIHLDFLAARYGHDDFVLVRTKVRADSGGRHSITGDDRLYHELLDWLRGTPPPGRAEVAARIDLDNLARWFVTVAFCATGDVFQGALVRPQAPEGRWFWIPWDLDQSFGYPFQPGDWHRDSVRSILRSNETRGTLLRRLLQSDPEFRRQVTATAADAFNHRLTPEFLERRVETYAEYGRHYRLEQFDPEPLRRFLRHRPQRLLELLGEHLDAGPPRRLRFEGPPGAALEVDGHRVTLPWQGWYYDGLTVEIAAGGGELELHREGDEETPPRRASRHRLTVEGDATFAVGGS